jgi:hypothetical protein
MAAGHCLLTRPEQLTRAPREAILYALLTFHLDGNSLKGLSPHSPRSQISAAHFPEGDLRTMSESDPHYFHLN